MKRYILFFPMMILVMVLGLAGCASINNLLDGDDAEYVVDTAKLTLEISVFETQYNKVSALMRTKQATENIFTDEEWRKLVNVDAAISMVLMKAKAIIKLNSGITIDELKTMYTLCKEGYGEAKSVIQGKWAKLDLTTQVVLTSIDTEVTLIDTQISKLSTNPSSDNFTTILTLIAGVLSLTTKSMSTALIAL